MKKDENGFVMIGIMLVIVSIWMMGITLISISMSNAKMKILSSQAKQNCYVCDGSIEAVKAKLADEIKEALKSGWSELDRFMEEEYEDFIDMEIQKEIEGEGSIYIESSKDQYGHLDYSLDKEKIDDMLNGIFKKKYSGYFCGENRINFVKGTEAVKIEDVKINVIDDMLMDKGEEIVFKVSSSKKCKNSCIIINVEIGVAVPGKDCGHLEYSKCKAMIPAVMDFDIVSPKPVNLENVEEARILNERSRISEMESIMLWDHGISNRSEDNIVYFGEDNIELDDSMRRGIIITRGYIQAGAGEFEGMLVGMEGIDCEEGFVFKRNRELVEKLIALNSLEDIFDASNMDPDEYAVSIEKLGKAKIHGDVDIEGLIDIRQWRRRL